MFDRVGVAGTFFVCFCGVVRAGAARSRGKSSSLFSFPSLKRVTLVGGLGNCFGDQRAFFFVVVLMVVESIGRKDLEFRVPRLVMPRVCAIMAN